VCRRYPQSAAQPAPGRLRHGCAPRLGRRPHVRPAERRRGAPSLHAGNRSRHRRLLRMEADVIPSPRRPEDTGLPFLFLADLAAKHFHAYGPQRLDELAARLKLAPGTTEPLIEFLRRERLCEVSAGSNGAGPTFALTDAGRRRAENALRHSQYAGAAPVTLEAYST